MKILLDDISANVEITGEGFPVVLLHGAFMNTHMWQPQQPLAEKLKLIAIDLRGHGETPCPVNCRSYDRPRDVMQILDALHVEKAVFCGLSMGGPVAIQLALDYPQRCLGLVLLATGPGPADRPMIATQEMKENAEREAQRLLELGPVEYFYTTPGSNASGVKEFLDQPGYRAVFDHILAQNDTDYLANTMRLSTLDLPNGIERLFTAQRTRRLPEINTPVLFMVGSIDIPFSRVAAYLQATIPHCETEIVPGASHLINIDSTGRVIERMLEFISSVVAIQPIVID